MICAIKHACRFFEATCDIMFLWIINIVHHFKHAASTIEKDTCQLCMRAGMSQERRLAACREMVTFDQRV
jgi:hypothetical protein